ncbi:sensor histidine kinase [Pleurocapsa sp. PCC 7319]|uniref:sensor histidine kinase n=1 Tax=Pleurocapsa sp. PCC 7319 TaxID=118161 RepID=UPI0003824706|nr:sensor histidine kinase [Pleurocapsa sp. PCC 7319]
MPIFVNEQFWGILGIDFCREAKRLTLPEIAVFKTAASCVGSAIYRQQIITEQKEAERAVIEERNELAREIHDTIGQSFTAIVMQLEAGKRLLITKSDRVSSCLNLAQNLAHQGITQVQQSLWTLRENADEYNDLVAAFQRLVTTLNTNVPVQIEFSTSGTQTPLSPDVRLNLLRIGQEAVTNALKHAEARQIDLNLIFNSDRLQLQIQDDGRGFAPELLGVNSGFGIKSIEQRAEQINAVVNIITNPGNGTTISVTVPL